MKKLLLGFTLISVLTLGGCMSQDEKENYKIKEETNQLIDQKSELEQSIKSLEEANDKERYIITLQIKQTHFSLDISEHMKDEANKTKIQIPVDKAFYDKVDEGDVLDESFRSGSFWFKGSIGSWEIKVVDKEILK